MSTFKLKIAANKSLKEEQYSLLNCINRVKKAFGKSKEVSDYCKACGILNLKDMDNKVTIDSVMDALGAEREQLSESEFKWILTKKYKGETRIKDKFSVWDVLNAIGKMNK